MFGMSQKYQVADLSLAVSCGLLPLLRDQCGGAEQLCKVMSMVVYSKHDSDGGDTLLQLACFRLWQIIAVSLGSLTNILAALLGRFGPGTTVPSLVAC